MGLIKDILYSQVQILKNIQMGSQPIFPFYHAVSDVDLPHIKNIYPIKNTNQFIADLDYLTSNYNILKPEVFIDCINNSKPFPQKSFLLTFDDGMSEVYHVIYPILKEKGIPAIFFLNNSFIDNKNLFYRHQLSLIVDQFKNGQVNEETIGKISVLLGVETGKPEKLVQEIRKIEYPRHNMLDEVGKLLGIHSKQFLIDKQPYLSSDQVREMRDEGFYFGAHTVNHYPLDKLSLEEQKKEIADSIYWVKSHFDIPYSVFAFPFSDEGIRLSVFESLIEEFPDLVLMGNSGIKKDTAPKMVQRFSLEDPNHLAEDAIPVSIAHSHVNKLIFKYKISRQ